MPEPFSPLPLTPPWAFPDPMKQDPVSRHLRDHLRPGESGLLVAGDGITIDGTVISATGAGLVSSVNGIPPAEGDVSVSATDIPYGNGTNVGAGIDSAKATANAAAQLAYSANSLASSASVAASAAQTAADSAASAAQSAQTAADSAASSAASHSALRNNPHGVSAAQIGALSTSGGSATDSIKVVSGSSDKGFIAQPREDRAEYTGYYDRFIRVNTVDMNGVAHAGILGLPTGGGVLAVLEDLPEYYSDASVSEDGKTLTITNKISKAYAGRDKTVTFSPAGAVTSVNGSTGAVVLTGENINYAPGTSTLTEVIDSIGRMASQAFEEASSAAGEIDSHTQDYTNPHNVTADQIGAVKRPDTIEEIGEDYTMDELKDKINTIIRALMACAVVCFGLFALADTVDTARLGSLKASAMVVTNVHFTAYQPILTAGENITISNNVISAAGGSVAPTGFENQTNTISYPTIVGNAVNLTITDAGVLAVNSNGWTDGQSVFVTIRPAGSYTVESNINLVGYGTFPTNAAQAVIWKVGTAYYLSVISAL